MSTNFPTSLDALTNPTATDDVSVVSHSAQHANANDAIEAIQAKLGIDGSAVTTSVDYKLAQLPATYQPLATVLTNTTASFTTAQETKLAGIATGATANSSDATLLARANHTGTQAIATVSGLQTALDGKVDENAAITGATKTKVTYDAKGLVTAGADATTADIAASTNKNYVTDAQLVVIGNTSGTNTGDQTSVTGNAGTATALQTARNINGVAFDGTANITVTAAAGTLSGATLAAGVTASSLTSVGTLTSLTVSDTIQAAAASNYTSILGGVDLNETDPGTSGVQYYAGNLMTFLDGTCRFNLSILKDFRIPSDHMFSWSSQADNFAAADTGLSRNAAGILEINNGTAGTFRDLKARAGTFSGALSATNLSGTNTGDQTSVTGNAGTATALQTARNINGVAFDGTANITVTAAAGTLSGATLAAGVTASSLTSVGTLTSLAVTNGITAATGVFSGAISASNLSGTNTGDQTTITGNAGTATALQTARNINGVAFDGTANITVTSAAGTLTGATLNSGVTASSLTSVGTLTGLTMGGTLAMGTNNITSTGSLGTTGSRLTKGWFTDLEVTNAITGSVTGNAATVTTNANLTGPITSSGNTTSVASQTGTGSTFVMNTSPTLVTPTLGVATATSLNLGNETMSAYRNTTYTPVLAFGGGSTGITYGTQFGRYHRVGSMVTVFIDIILTNKGSSTGNATITLPAGLTSATGGAVVAFASVDSTSGLTGFIAEGLIQNGGTTILLRKQKDGGDSGIDNTHFTNTTVVRLNMSYTV